MAGSGRGIEDTSWNGHGGSWVQILVTPSGAAVVGDGEERGWPTWGMVEVSLAITDDSNVCPAPKPACTDQVPVLGKVTTNG